MSPRKEKGLRALSKALNHYLARSDSGTPNSTRVQFYLSAAFWVFGLAYVVWSWF